MSLYSHVYPVNRTPEKAQIEQMYRVCLVNDIKFFQPEDVDRFGLDMKEYNEGGVRMKAPLAWLRKHVEGLWNRMNKEQKVLFLMSYVVPAIDYTNELLQEVIKILEKDIPVVGQFERMKMDVVTSVAKATTDVK